uniref:Tetraspanin 1 n=1 Tax=Pygocentrus nattereri TaxID=42514 RepID=A0A3B4DP49_PYGNA
MSCVVLQTCMFAVPVFLQVGGLALTAVGIWLNVAGDSRLQFLGIFDLNILHSVNFGYFFIAIGGVMALLGFLGCCGAKKESKCLLIMVISNILHYQLENVLNAWSTPVLKEQYGKDKMVTDMWNVTMTKLHCCGYNNYTDFNNSYYYEENGDIYPPNCCEDPEILCDAENALQSDIKVRKDIVKMMVLRKSVYMLWGLAKVRTVIMMYKRADIIHLFYLFVLNK